MSKTPSYELVKITPQMAQDWLNKSAFDNRRIEDTRITKLSSDIKKGKWIFDGSPIRFNGKDNILDGQHRLRAVIKAGIPVESLVIRGLPTESKNTIDTGKARSISDVLHFNGFVNTAALAATARLVVAHREYKGDLQEWSKSSTKAAISNQELLQEVETNAVLVKANQAIVGLKYTKKICGASVPAFCYYLFTKLSSQHIADSFFQQIEHGHNLAPDSPILLLRNALTLRDSTHSLSGQRRATYVIALFIKAWNAWRNKEKIIVLKHDRADKYPIAV